MEIYAEESWDGEMYNDPGLFYTSTGPCIRILRIMETKDGETKKRQMI